MISVRVRPTDELRALIAVNVGLTVFEIFLGFLKAVLGGDAVQHLLESVPAYAARSDYSL